MHERIGTRICHEGVCSGAEVISGGRRTLGGKGLALMAGWTETLSAVARKCDIRFSNEENSRHMNCAQKSVNTKVVEKCLGYNFRVWSFLIFAKDFDIY